jgi:hypothetical protein
MLLEIMYDNYEPWSGRTDVPYYYYKPMVIKQSSYKFLEPIYGEYRQVRESATHRHDDDETTTTHHHQVTTNRRGAGVSSGARL